MDQNTQGDPSAPQPVTPPVVENATGPAVTQRQDMSKLLLPGAIVAASFMIFLSAAVIGGAIVYTHKTDTQAAAANAVGGTQPTQPTVDVKDVNTVNEPFIGDANAKTTIAYWSDFQCPYCKKFESDVLPSIITDYIKTKKVKLVFKDFQFLGPDSTTAALTARAVWDLYPQSYFAWRTAMFDKQDAENSGFGDSASIQQVTKTIAGIDNAKVQQAMTTKKAAYQAEIDADRNEAEKFGIQGTPGFIVGTTLIPGSLPYASFKQVIDGAMK